MLLSGKKILIVEDNSMNRIVYQISLGLQGAIIDFDWAGKHIIKKLLRLKPDLIILDLMLPRGQSGFSLYDEIRQISGYETIPIIAVSASDPAVALPQVKAQGFTGFIAKPINEALFPQQILQVLNGEEIWIASKQY